MHFQLPSGIHCICEKAWSEIIQTCFQKKSIIAKLKIYKVRKTQVGYCRKSNEQITYIYMYIHI